MNVKVGMKQKLRYFFNLLCSISEWNGFWNKKKCWVGIYWIVVWL